MASSTMLRAGNFCYAGSFHYKSVALNHIKIRSDSRIKTIPVKFKGGNPCWKITALEPKTRTEAAPAVTVEEVVAFLQVKLINADNEDPGDIYGKILAATPQETITLFNKGSKEYVQVRPQGLIPLEVNKVVVPSNSAVVISADLFDYDSLSADDPIAQGQVSIRAAESGTISETITGMYGSVQVIVSWAPRSA